MRAIVKKYIDRRTECEGDRRLVHKRKRIFELLRDLTNKIVIFVDKAVPTLLVNYLPMKDEKNRLSVSFRTVIFLERIPGMDYLSL